MFTKARTAAAVAALAATMLVATPSVAHAEDQTLWSTSGRSYLWFSDVSDQITVCDMRNGDGVGAQAHVTGSQPRRDRVVYNGCETFHDVGDGWEHNVSICDWVYNGLVRTGANCRYATWST